MATKFVRGEIYMMRDSQRYASKVHGAVVPLIEIANLATTLQANWFYKILHTNECNNAITMPHFYLNPCGSPTLVPYASNITLNALAT